MDVCGQEKQENMQNYLKFLLAIRANLTLFFSEVFSPALKFSAISNGPVLV